MFKVAICDDEQAICSQIENIIIDYCKNSSVKIDIEVFCSGEELCEFIENNNSFELIFLDIEFKEMSGIEVGRKIRKQRNDEITQIIYISAKQGYAMDLFENRPYNFLLKPLREEKIIQYLKEVIKFFQGHNLFFEFNMGKEFFKIPYEEIIYFKSDNKKISIITVDKSYECYGKLADIKQRLLDKEFLFIHKSYFVNYLYISKSQYDKVMLTNEEELSISQTYRKEVRDTLMKYRKGRN